MAGHVIRKGLTWILGDKVPQNVTLGYKGPNGGRFQLYYGIAPDWLDFQASYYDR